MRTFTAANRDYLERRIEELVRGIATAMGAEVDFSYVRGYPATVNDPAMTELVREEAARVVGEEGVRDGDLMMGAEDFSYFLEAVPGAFWFVGSQNPGAWSRLGPPSPAVRSRRGGDGDRHGIDGQRGAAVS